MVSKNQYDFLVADYLSTAIYGYLINQKFGIPWAYSSHNVEFKRFLDFARDDIKRYPLVPYYYFVERLGCRADLLISISKLDALVFKKWVPNSRMLILPQGFDEGMFHPPAQEHCPDPPVILFYGLLSHLPNNQAVYIIYNKIMPKVVAEYPNAIFRFVGDKPPNDIKHPNIEFKGYATDLVEEIHKSSMVIAPILQGGGMRTKIIESLACGKQVVSTPKGAEGIDIAIESMKICEIDDFPGVIIDVLNSSTCDPSSDFDLLRKKYSWDVLLPRLKVQIDSIINYDKTPVAL
jgi:glycosyltransferase involved in cell wall biosynthesis